MNPVFLACKNLKTRFSFYSFYLVSVAFVIAVLFAFTSFSENRIILEKMSSDGRVETMCRTISVFLMVFVVFYMAYSNRFFLRRRTRELGIYTLLGYQRSQILTLLTVENVLICLGAFFFGVTLGGLAHRGIVWFIGNLLRLGIDVSDIALFDGTALFKTAVFVLAVVFAMTLSNGRLLYQSSLIQLVRFEKRAEKTMKFHKVPAILGFTLIFFGYLSALNVLEGNDSLWVRVGFYQMGLFTLFLVTAGTVLFISAFLPYVMEKSKHRKQTFYTSERIITTPNFVYRIRSNARTLTMLTLLSAAALTIVSVMALTLYYPIAAVSRIAPSEIEFRLESEEQLKIARDLAEQYTSDSPEVDILRTDLYSATSDSASLPPEYNLGTSQSGADNETIARDAGFECMSYTQYTKLLTAQGRSHVLASLPALSEEECILIKYQPEDPLQKEQGQTYQLQYPSGECHVTVKKVSLDNVISFANSIGTLVVNDRLYEEIRLGQSPCVSVVSMNGSSLKNQEGLYQALSDYLGGSPYLQGNSHRIQELLYLNSSTFLLIGFLVVLFFLAVGSILYFNNLSSVADSRADYEILEKIGYRKKQLRRIIRRQVFPFFAIPFLLGLLDCLFATMVYKAGLMQNLLGNSISQYLPTFVSLLLAALVYGSYYALTVRSCCRAVWKNASLRH